MTLHLRNSSRFGFKMCIFYTLHSIEKLLVAQVSKLTHRLFNVLARFALSGNPVARAILHVPCLARKFTEKERKYV